MAMPWPRAPVQGWCGTGAILVQSSGIFPSLDLLLSWRKQLGKVWPLLFSCSGGSSVLQGCPRRGDLREGGVGCPEFSEGWDVPALRWLWEAGISTRFSG